MGQNNEWINSSFDTFGPAEMQIIDDALTTSLGHDCFMHMCRFRNISFQPQYTYAEQMHRWEGMDVETARELVATTAALNCTIAENINPAAMQLVYGDLLSTQTLANPSVSYESAMSLLFYNQRTLKAEERHIPHSSGGANYTRLPAPTISAAAPTGSDGSGWSTAGNPDYYFWAQGFYLKSGQVMPSETTISAAGSVDANWTAGAPSDDAAGTAGYNGEPVNFANATQHVLLTITDPTGPVALPDFYAVWYNTTDNIATATCQKTIARDVSGTTSYTPLGPTAGANTYYAYKGARFYKNVGTHASPSWTEMVVDTDITWDNVRGAFKLISSALNGLWVRAAYFYVKPYTAKNTVGPTGTSTDPRRVRIVDLRPETKGADPQYPEGQVFELYSVDFCGVSGGEEFSSDQFFAGQSVSLKCLTDPGNSGQFGHKTIYSNKLKSYTQQSV